LAHPKTDLHGVGAAQTGDGVEADVRRGLAGDVLLSQGGVLLLFHSAFKQEEALANTVVPAAELLVAVVAQP